MSEAREIIGRFGGISALARALGHRNATTVQGWAERGVIPIRQIPAVLTVAQRLGIAITVADLVPDQAP